MEPTSAPLLISPSCLVPTVFAGRLPQPTRLPPPDGHAAFTALQVLFGRPTPRRASLPTSLSLIGSVAAAPPADPPRSPRVTHWSSIPCRPQTPWCGGWMRSPSPQCRLDLAPPLADRFVMGSPLDSARSAPQTLGPHLTRCLFRRGGSRSTCVQACVPVPSATCAGEALPPPLDTAPLPGAGGTSTLLTCFLRTLRASPPPSPARPDPHGLSVGTVPRRRQGFPCCVHSPLPCVPPPIPRRNRPVLPSLASRPVAAFPVLWAGRLPHSTFRGLLGVHSRCGPHGR